MVTPKIFRRRRDVPSSTLILLVRRSSDWLVIWHTVHPVVGHIRDVERFFSARDAFDCFRKCDSYDDYYASKYYF